MLPTRFHCFMPFTGIRSQGIFPDSVWPEGVLATGGLLLDQVTLLNGRAVSEYSDKAWSVG